MIKAVCAIPTFNSAPILWLQLESLCRQETDYAWELIVLECRDVYREDPVATATGSYLEPYRARLADAGCKRIRYASGKRRLALSLKWPRIARMASPTAETFLLCASDNFSYPTRIQESVDAIEAGAAWFDRSEGHFYNVLTERLALWSRSRGNAAMQRRTGLFMATRTDAVRALPDAEHHRGIDTWMRNAMGFADSLHIKSERRGGSLHTDGYNQISHARRDLYHQEPQRPFYATEAVLEDIVPPEVAERLRSMKPKPME